VRDEGNDTHKVGVVPLPSFDDLFILKGDSVNYFRTFYTPHPIVQYLDRRLTIQ